MSTENSCSDTRLQVGAVPGEERGDLAKQQLESVSQSLRATKKILARDWEQLSPRQRSAYARQVKALEQQQKALLQEIELIEIDLST